MQVCQVTNVVVMDRHARQADRQSFFPLLFSHYCCLVSLHSAHVRNIELVNIFFFSTARMR